MLFTERFLIYRKGSGSRNRCPFLCMNPASADVCRISILPCPGLISADPGNQSYKKKMHGRNLFRAFSFYFMREYVFCYQNPIPPPCGIIGAAGVSSLISATRLSVVSTIEATEAAFWSAERVTFVGSTIPEGIISTYCSL